MFGRKLVVPQVRMFSALNWIPFDTSDYDIVIDFGYNHTPNAVLFAALPIYPGLGPASGWVITEYLYQSLYQLTERVMKSPVTDRPRIPT